MAIRTSSVSRCLDLLERLTAERLGLLEYVAVTRPAIRRAIGFDGWCLGMADPVSRLPNTTTVEDAPLSGLLPQFWQFEFEQLAELTAAGGCAIPNGVRTAAAARDPLSVRRFDELLRTDGVADELRIPLVSEGAYWGSVDLFRSAGGRAFDEDEATAARALMPALGAGTRSAWAITCTTAAGAAANRAEAGGEPGGAPGTMLLSGAGAVVSQTPQTLDWLMRLGPPFRMSHLPAMVAMLRVRPTASTQIRTARGLWVSVSGGRLSPAAGPAQFAVTFQAAPPAEVTALLLRALGLTPRQRVVARLLLAGHSGQQIASALQLSLHTVNDHTRAVEAKAGVHSRAELAAVLTGHPAAGGPRTSGF